MVDFYAIEESVGSAFYIIVLAGGEEAMFLLDLKPELFFPGKMYRVIRILQNRYRYPIKALFSCYIYYSKKEKKNCLEII